MTMLSPAQEADNKLGYPTVAPTPATSAAPAPAAGPVSMDGTYIGGLLGSAGGNFLNAGGGVGVTNPTQLAAIGAAGASVDAANQLLTGVTGIAKMVDAWATSVGLGSLSGWINQQIQQLAGLGMGASDIATTINSTINSAPGFDALMPGYNQRITNGYTNTDPNTGAGIAGYLAYRQQIQAMAETAGMVPGTISAQDIGNAWAGDVSTNELSARITTEYTNAINAMPQIQQQLQAYGYVQGITPGQLASYYLNPNNTINTLQQQFNSAVVGGEGTLTGFGDLGQSKAYALQAFLSNSGQNNLSPSQAANFFSGSLGSGLGSLSAMAQTGFEQAQLGTASNGPGFVSQDQLISAGEGNAGALQNVQRAAQTRAAGSSGGGGLAADQSGVKGIGYGSQ